MARPAHSCLVLVAVAALVAVAILAASCGKQEGGGTAEVEVESLVRLEVAEGLLAEYEPTDAEIRETAQRVPVSCEPAKGGHYDCGIDYGGELGTIHCLVGPNDSLSELRFIHCGGSEAPDADEEFTDCTTVAETTTAEDPAGDVEGGEPALVEQADLLAVHVAATSDRLCVQWETAAPIEPDYGLNFWLYPEPPTEDDLALAVSLDPGAPPEISPGPYMSISGRFGTDGTLASLVVEEEDLPGPYQRLLEPPFTFAAHTARVTDSEAGTGYSDDLDGKAYPNGFIDRPDYP